MNPQFTEQELECPICRERLLDPIALTLTTFREIDPNLKLNKKCFLLKFERELIFQYLDLTDLLNLRVNRFLAEVVWEWIFQNASIENLKITVFGEWIGYWKIYVAGKITNCPDWRGIGTNRPESTSEAIEPFPYVLKYYGNSNSIYIGPWPMRCDAKQYHIGCNADCWNSVAHAAMSETRGRGCVEAERMYGTPALITSEDILYNSQQQIKECDIFFARLSSDAYATIAEVGYASALKKIIFLDVDPSVSLKEYWFIVEMSLQSLGDLWRCDLEFQFATLPCNHFFRAYCAENQSPVNLSTYVSWLRQKINFDYPDSDDSDPDFYPMDEEMFPPAEEMFLSDEEIQPSHSRDSSPVRK